MLTRPYTEDEIDEFLAAFEAGTLPKEQWTHAAHLITGACYVYQLGLQGAVSQMRERLRSYNEAVGGKNTTTAGYHETLTVFWIEVLGVFLRQEPAESRAAFAASAVERFADQRDLFRLFYDFDIVVSLEARAAWIPPGQSIDLAARLRSRPSSFL